MGKFYTRIYTFGYTLVYSHAGRARSRTRPHPLTHMQVGTRQRCAGSLLQRSLVHTNARKELPVSPAQQQQQQHLRTRRTLSRFAKSRLSDARGLSVRFKTRLSDAHTRRVYRMRTLRLSDAPRLSDARGPTGSLTAGISPVPNAAQRGRCLMRRSWQPQGLHTNRPPLKGLKPERARPASY